jgi:tetratricopeptide (TPR) repeat protein
MDCGRRAKSLRYIQQAIDADPTYAEAYADLAYMFTVLGTFEYAPPTEMFPRAQAAVRKALDLDAGHAGAHAVFAFTRIVFDWDFAGAEYEARRAIALAPQAATGYYAFSQWCLTQCRFEEAIAAARKSLELDALTLFKTYNLGLIYLYARREGEAIEHLKQILEIDPSFWMGFGILALAYARSGDYEEALAAIDRCPKDASAKAVLGMVQALFGKPDEARSILRELMNEKSVATKVTYPLAGIHAELGEPDDAFECLGKALNGRSPQIAFLAADPNFDKLRHDPRWGDLLRRVGLVSI